MSMIGNLNQFAMKCLAEGITETIVIHNEQLFNRLFSDELALRRYGNILPHDSNSLTYRTPGPDVEVRRDGPETVQKLVRNELNRRAMQTMKYRR